MFIDASAICAILLKEVEAEPMVRRIERAERRLTSPTAVWEAVVAATRELRAPVSEAESAVKGLIQGMNIEIVPIPPEAAALAVDAYASFGKGRHPAGLNFGDCFAYACARHYGLPLLYKGGDFALTDIEAA